VNDGGVSALSRPWFRFDETGKSVKVATTMEIMRGREDAQTACRMIEDM
jgi:hypothetical protein